MIRSLLAAILLSATAAVSAADSADRHVNATLGFAITKPPGWHWMTAQQNLENLRRARLGSEKFQQQVVQHASAPLVVMTAHPEPYDRLNASFKANIRPFGTLPTRDPQQLLAMILPTLQQQMSDARLAVPVHAVQVDGRAGAHAVVEYTLRTADGGAFPTASELWIVPAGDYFFMLGAGYAQGDEAARGAVSSVLQSIDLPDASE